jgi:molybdenum cofactor biosynthesis protein B
MGLEQHRAESPAQISFAVITVSDTRSAETDRGGDFLVRAVEGAGHRVGWRTLVRDEAAEIARAAKEASARPDVDLVLLTGGTGIAPRDVTAPTLEGIFESPIPGIGELFRWLSYQEIGSAAVLSRATAGLVHGKVAIALPGSPRALELAMAKIVLPEAGHLVAQARGTSRR